MKKLFWSVIFFLFILAGALRAQNVAITTNLGDWALLGTANATVQVGVGQHFSLEGVGKFNNWNFVIQNNGGNQIEWKQTTASFGFRWWPWYIYSGWFVGAKAQYQKYKQANMLWVSGAEDGTAYGLGITAGYSIQLNKWFNIDLGIGGWGGYKNYTSYSDISRAQINEQGSKAFFAPNEIIIAAMFIF